MKSVALHNLGCKVNSYETAVMEQRLREAGYEIVPFDGTPADVYIINTCTVTNIADRKSRQMLHRAKKDNPEATVVAVGCYVETDPSRVQMDECIDVAVGSRRKADIVDVLDRYFAGEAGDGDFLRADSEDLLHDRNYEAMQLETRVETTRAFLKIQDGCNQFCSYSIIPFARGRICSRPAEDVIREVRAQAQQGVKEIVLSGIHLSSYGADLKEDRPDPLAAFDAQPLLELLRGISEIPGIERIRLGSLEPRLITRETAEAFAAIPKLCPHFHLSLQSGSDTVLKRMNRHYTTEEYARGVELLRSVYDRPAITTDIIVGFPGETEEEFAQTVAFVKRIRFYEIHVFKYTRPQGTEADRMDGQLTDREKSARSEVLLKLTAEQAQEYRSSFVGEPLDVLAETTEEIDGTTYRIGFTQRYVKVAIPAETEPGDMITTVPQKLATAETLL